MRTPLFYTLPALMASLVFSLALSAPAAAGVMPNEASQALVDEGWLAQSKGQSKLAYEKFSEAAKRDPNASTPLSAMADLVWKLSNVNGNDTAKLRSQAQSLVQRALQLAPNDPVAQEVARSMAEGDASPLHKANRDAREFMRQAEILFISKQYDEALKKYEQAAQADPLWSVAWLYAGDCFFARKDLTQAEIRFRKATEVEPLNSQAWRFLADALLQQGRQQEAVDALLMGIAAQPSQLPNWDRLAKSGERNAMPFKRLAFARNTSVKVDSTGNKTDISITPEALESKDAAVWLALTLNEASLADKHVKGTPTLSPFQTALANWTFAMQVAKDLEAKGEALEDPGLLTMQMLAREGQLEPALLLLTYKESYRPDFEAWKKTHPDGIKQFVNNYGLRP
jgi:tetratricopeptide (TPR) repeat protein